MSRKLRIIFIFILKTIKRLNNSTVKQKTETMFRFFRIFAE